MEGRTSCAATITAMVFIVVDDEILIVTCVIEQEQFRKFGIRDQGE